MQTFLPFPDYVLSAKVLDNKRLNKQIVEVQQILNSLTQGTGWIHHPIVKMWKGYEGSLIQYGLACYAEWQTRYDEYRRNGNRQHKSGDFLMKQSYLYGNTSPPKWIGNWELHISHQSNLLRKDYDHYRSFFPDTPDNLEYVWIKS